MTLRRFILLIKRHRRVSNLRKLRKSSRKGKKKLLNLKKERTSKRRCKRALRTNLSAARMAALRMNKKFTAVEATKLKKFRELILKVALACLVLQRKDSIPITSIACVDSLAKIIHKNQIKAQTRRILKMR